MEDLSVAVFPADRRLWNSVRRTALGRLDRWGAFSIGTLPPGTYAVAVLPSRDGLTFRDPRLLESLQATAQTVSLSEGGRADIVLRRQVLMSAISKSTVWTAYFATYVAGVAALVYVTRTSPMSRTVLLLPFAFAAILVALGSLAAHLEARGQRVERHDGPTPVRQRPATVVAWTIVGLIPLAGFLTPPAVVNPSMRLFFILWVLACAVFSGVVMPRLLRSESSLQ